MRNKIPAAAFQYYVDLGPARTYGAVARHFGVSVRGVTKRALNEGWQARLAAIEAEARVKTDEKLADSAAAVNERHLRVIRAMQGKALQALQALPLGSGMDAIRALDLSIKAERVVLGTDGTGGGTRPIVLNVVTGTPAELGEPGQRDDLPVLPVVRRLPERGTEG